MIQAICACISTLLQQQTVHLLHTSCLKSLLLQVPFEVCCILPACQHLCW